MIKIGDVFTYLTVIAIDNTNITTQCVCGVVCERQRYALLAGRVKSCGCMKGKMHAEIITKPDGYAQYNKLLASYRSGAKNRNLCFELSFDQFKSIVIQNCHYCGAQPKLNILDKKEKNHPNHCAIDVYMNGIDRIDSNIGYIIDNCVPCCAICNRAKMDQPYDKFVNYINRLSELGNKWLKQA